MRRAVLGTSRPLKTQAQAAYYALRPHPDNSTTRKTVTLALVATWIILTILISTDHAVPTEAYAALSAWVWRRFGKIEEQEAQRIEESESSN